jgi:hypothetical protein
LNAGIQVAFRVPGTSGCAAAIPVQGKELRNLMSEALSLLGSAYRVRCVRADSGFYADNFL